MNECDRFAGIAAARASAIANQPPFTSFDKTDVSFSSESTSAGHSSWFPNSWLPWEPWHEERWSNTRYPRYTLARKKLAWPWTGRNETQGIGKYPKEARRVSLRGIAERIIRKANRCARRIIRDGSRPSVSASGSRVCTWLGSIVTCKPAVGRKVCLNKRRYRWLPAKRNIGRCRKPCAYFYPIGEASGIARGPIAVTCPL